MATSHLTHQPANHPANPVRYLYDWRHCFEWPSDNNLTPILLETLANNLWRQNHNRENAVWKIPWSLIKMKSNIFDLALIVIPTAQVLLPRFENETISIVVAKLQLISLEQRMLLTSSRDFLYLQFICSRQMSGKKRNSFDVWIWYIMNLEGSVLSFSLILSKRKRDTWQPAISVNVNSSGWCQCHSQLS